MDLDIDSMRAYLAVLDRGTMTAAAASLDLTTSAVSWRMKRLEQRVGQDLLIRDGRSLRPSRAGRAILPHVRAMVEAHDRAAAMLSAEELSGRVHIGAHEDIGIERLTRLLGTFARTHPNTELAFTMAGSEELNAALRRGDLDIAVVGTPEERLRPTDRILWSEQIIWATGRGMPFEDDPVPVISYDDGCRFREMGTDQLREAGIAFHVRFTIPNTSGVVAAMRDGLGVSVISPSQLTPDIEPWARVAHLPPLPTNHYVVRTVPGDLGDAVDALAEVIFEDLSRPMFAAS